MSQYLYESFLGNKPYDSLVRELLTAAGSNAAGAEDYNPAVNFLSGKLADNAVQATTRTAEIFLGTRVQCTQCHNHPFNDRKQSLFWELNSFYRQTRLELTVGTSLVGIRMIDKDFVGEDGRTPDNAEVYYEMRNGKLAAAWPRFLDGRQPPSASGLLKDVNRRQVLADLVLSSSDLQRTLVNRIWAHFFTYGFTRPVEDLGPHNPPAMPELLDLLATQFGAHSHDQKQLIKWITLSEAYGLSSRGAKRNQDEDPALGGVPRFNRFYLRQMRAEELYDSLLTATSADQTAREAQEQAEARQRWLDQFVVAFGNDEGEERSTFNGTIPQALMMRNGELVEQATGVLEGSFLYRLAADSSLTNADRIRKLYLAGLARQPSTTEIRAANQLLLADKSGGTEALADVWWAILNSGEFILNH
jgi:hypothetical protein